MHSLFRLLRGFVALTIFAAIAAAIAAAMAKDRMPSRGEPADDELDLVTIFDSLVFRSTATALRRATATAWFGGGTLDLRGATLDPAGARLTLRTIFGGYRVVVPETWRVELGVAGVFGGAGDTRSKDHVDPDRPLLTIDGFALFGGAGVVDQAPDLDAAATPGTAPAATVDVAAAAPLSA